MEQRFLEALRPDQVTLALAALAQMEQADRAERKQWEVRLERARYETTRAERQYQAVESENRLVARSLERQWEDKLRTVEPLRKSTRRGAIIAAWQSLMRIERPLSHWGVICQRSGKRKPRPMQIGNRCCA